MQIRLNSFRLSWHPTICHIFLSSSWVVSNRIVSMFDHLFSTADSKNEILFPYVSAFASGKLNHTVSNVVIQLIFCIFIPWSVVFGVIYLKPQYGMEVVTIAFIVTFFFPVLEIICIINYVGSLKRLFSDEDEN